MHILENDCLRIGVLPKGAELRSLLDKRNDFEWIWQADPAYWGKSSPILFPIVGALKEERLTYKNQTYHMARHGFAREKDFNLLEQSDSKLVFELTSNEQTKISYPFDFSLLITYELSGSELSVSYEVQNTGREIMYFSLGAHPAFNLPAGPGAGMSNYIEFPNDKILDRYYLYDNLLSKQSFRTKLEHNKLFLNNSIFNDDAWIMKNVVSKGVYLKEIEGIRELHFYYENFSYLGLWAVPGSPFVCLEPWAGLPDSAMHNCELKQKEGIIALDALKRWSARWKVII